MTALPFHSAAFDAAYATESLEHAVDIESRRRRNVPRGPPRRPHRDHRQERRTVGPAGNPGMGTVVPPRGTRRLLARHCREVSSRFISYWEDVQPDGLFLAWLARK